MPAGAKDQQRSDVVRHGKREKRDKCHKFEMGMQEEIQRALMDQTPLEIGEIQWQPHAIRRRRWINAAENPRQYIYQRYNDSDWLVFSAQ